MFQSLKILISVAVSCVVASCASAPRSGRDSGDVELRNRVQAAMHADPNLLARHIDVSVEQGVVNLTGKVFSSRDFELAKRDAQTVAGVKEVRSNLELVRSGSR
jgi:osmotically-inducible protein OsmY